MCIHWGGKEEVAHQVITKNTHSAIRLLPDFKEGRRGESLEKPHWGDGREGAFVKGATLKGTVRLRQESNIDNAPMGKCELILKQHTMEIN